MRTAVNAEDFRNALKKAYAACQKKGLLPALENVLVTFSGDTCTLTGTDTAVWCEAAIPADGGSFSFILTDTKQLLTACKYFSGPLLLDYAPDQPPESAPDKANLDGTITLQCCGKTCMQRVMCKEGFPTKPAAETTEEYAVDPAALYRRFDRIKYAVSDSNGRPNVTCVRFQGSRMITVDGYRLAVSEDDSLQVSNPFLVPASVMKHLTHLSGDCRMLVGKKHVVFETADVRLTAKIPWDEPMDLDRLISDPKESCTVEIGPFLKELRYLSEFITSQRTQSIRFEGGLLNLMHSPSRSSARLALSEPPMTVIAFAARYMMEALKQFDAKKVRAVTMGLTSSLSPIVLSDGEGDLAMVLPTRLSAADAA